MLHFFGTPCIPRHIDSEQNTLDSKNRNLLSVYEAIQDLGGQDVGWGDGHK